MLPCLLQWMRSRPLAPGDNSGSTANTFNEGGAVLQLLLWRVMYPPVPHRFIHNQVIWKILYNFRAVCPLMISVFAWLLIAFKEHPGIGSSSHKFSFQQRLHTFFRRFVRTSSARKYSLIFAFQYSCFRALPIPVYILTQPQPMQSTTCIS